MQRKKSSRRPARPTRCCATRTSARPTTAMVMRGWAAQGIWRRSVRGRRGPGRHLRRFVRRDVHVGGAQGSGAGSRQQRGDDLRFDLTIDFEDAFFGTETEVKIRRLETCATCSGSGSASGRGPSDLRAVPGARATALSAGILLRGADVRGVRRNGPGDRRSVHGLPRRTRAKSGDQAECEGAAGRGRGNAHPLRRAKATRVAWAGRGAICMWFFRCGRTISSSARATICIA